MAKRSKKTSNLGRVPGSILDLIDRLGGKLAFRVLEIRGGSILWVPVQAAADHPLRKLLGDEDFEKLVYEYRGLRLELPKNDALLRKHRHMHVQELRERGQSLSNIATSANYTRRQVVNILNASVQAQPQLDMFDDHVQERVLDDNHLMPTAHNPFGIGPR